MQRINQGKSLFTAGALVLAAVTLLLTPLRPAVADSTLQGKQIAMVIGFMGYDTSELYEPKKAFEAQGGVVHVFSTETGEAISGGGVGTNVERVIDTLRVDDYDALVFVGGSGAGEYFEHKKAHAMIHKALKDQKIVASICVASTILAKAGVLEGKNATGYHKAPIVEHGGHYSSEFVVKDGNLITAVGPNVVKEFADTIIQALQ